MDVEQAVVGQFVAGGVFEEPFNRIQFRGVGRQIRQVQTLVFFRERTQQFGLVCIEIVPYQHDRPAELAMELFDKRQHAVLIDGLIQISAKQEPELFGFG